MGWCSVSGNSSYVAHDRPEQVEPRRRGPDVPRLARQQLEAMGDGRERAVLVAQDGERLDLLPVREVALGCQDQHREARLLQDVLRLRPDQETPEARDGRATR